MNRFFKWGLAGIFTAMAAPVAAQPKDYTVIDNIAPQFPQHVILPDRELPPPGPSRQAAQRWVRDIPAVADTYTVLLRDDDGNYAQCAGMRFDTQTPEGAAVLKYRTFEPLAAALPVLRLMHEAPKAENWPILLGGCTTVDAQEINDSISSIVQLRLGPDIVLDQRITVYGDETDAHRAVRLEREIMGGISVRGNAVFRCPAAGWSDELRQAQKGDRVRLPGLCPN